MNETETPVLPPAPTTGRRRKRWLLAAAGLVVISLTVLGGWLFYGHWQLRQAITEADRLDPGWRWEELEARRATVAEDENSAAKVLVVKRALPAVWSSPSTDKALLGTDPAARLNSAQLWLLEGDLQAAAPALEPARSLADFPRGRFASRPAPVVIMMPCNEVQYTREVSQLLSFEATYRAEQGQAKEALAACRAGLNAGRSIGDWHLAIGMLVRIACQNRMLPAIERTLAQTEPEEADLAALQRLLEDEASQPLLLYAARGERAMMDDLFDAFQSGRISGSDVSAAFAMATGPLNIEGYRMELALKSRRRRAEMLRHHTRLVEIAKLPVEQQKVAIEQDRMDHPSEGLADVPLFGSLLEGGEYKWMYVFARSQSRLRTMIALLAAERFRRAHGRWPKTLDELCPEFLSAVPLDPGDGKPIKLRRMPDGLVIYAIGQDGKDHGGKLDPRKWNAPGIDYGFRLWDVNRRRQPASPPIMGPPPQGDE